MKSRGKYKPSQEADRYQGAHHGKPIFRTDGSFNLGKFVGVHHTKAPEWYLRWCRANMTGYAEQFEAIGKPKAKVKKDPEMEALKKMKHNDRLAAITQRVRARGKMDEIAVGVLDDWTAFCCTDIPY